MIVSICLVPVMYSDKRVKTMVCPYEIPGFKQVLDKDITLFWDLVYDKFFEGSSKLVRKYYAKT